MFQYMLTASTVLGDTLIVLISIILLLFLVKYFAWDKIEAMLEARRQKISKDLEEAEKKRKAAEEIQANAKEIIHNAEAKGQEILNSTREAASKMQDEMIKDVLAQFQHKAQLIQTSLNAKGYEVVNLNLDSRNEMPYFDRRMMPVAKMNSFSSEAADEVNLDNNGKAELKASVSAQIKLLN